MKQHAPTRHALVALFAAAGIVAAIAPTPAHAVTQQEVDSAQAALEDLALQCAIANEALEETRYAAELTDCKIDELEGALEDKNAEYEEAQQNLRTWMSYSYKNGELSTFELLLSSKTFDELISNIRYARDIANYGTKVVNTVNEVKEQLELERTGLDEVKQEQEERLAEQQVQADQLAAAQSAQQAYLDGLSAELRAQIDLERAEAAAKAEAERKAKEEAEAAAQQQQEEAAEQEEETPEEQPEEQTEPEQEAETESEPEPQPEPEPDPEPEEEKEPAPVIDTDESDEARAARERVLSIARTQLGVPYQRNATQWGTLLDCSGFTYLVYQKAGYPIPRCQNQANGGKNSQCYYVRTQCVWKTDPADLEPGDLMFFGTDITNTQHVGIYVGDGQTIEADGQKIAYLTVWSPSSSWHHFLGGGSPIRKK